MPNILLLPCADFCGHQKYYKLSDNTYIKAIFQDTMGTNSHIHSLFLPKYSIANSVILIYDIKNKKSFEQCCYYKENIKKLCNEDIEVILLGNEQNEQIYDNS